ncbi:hypothetical protein [Sporosarcina sp. Marseille-Q4943]|uniref:hypothetical protein n=1 Tax=Sporosarcina sp. Marseille-Q4943 TaxID=2942204 RepID=UPI00208DD48A|nr:hypothetical protein [Sporosarcina sp. Marseille-Q4943]
MAFKAEVLRVLIASPSDVHQERNEIEKAIFDWNNLYSEETEIVLLPGRWENDVTPTYSGTEAQEVINKQLVSKCDILIGVFWTKLGTPTLNHSSGTLEEINIFIEQGKEVMVYFVDRDIPRSANFDEVRKVDEYKEQFGRKAVYAPYNSSRIVNHLYNKVIDYKREKELVSENKHNNPVQSIDKNEVTQEMSDISLDQLILSKRLTPNEILLLGYTLNTGDRRFGYRWMAEETLEKIKNWERSYALSDDLSTNYNEVIANLAERGLIEKREYTSHGNVRLYTMSIPIYDQLCNLSVEIKNIIKSMIKSIEVELPF